MCVKVHLHQKESNTRNLGGKKYSCYIHLTKNLRQSSYQYHFKLNILPTKTRIKV